MKALLFSVALIFALPAYAQTTNPVDASGNQIARDEAHKIIRSPNSDPAELGGGPGSTMKPPGTYSAADIGKAIISGAEGERVGGGTISPAYSAKSTEDRR